VNKLSPVISPVQQSSPQSSPVIRYDLLDIVTEDGSRYRMDSPFHFIFTAVQQSGIYACTYCLCSYPFTETCPTEAGPKISSF